MPTDRPSRADEELVSRLQDAGVKDMTWMRLKRWRKAGLVPDPEQQRVPGQRGSTSVYPEEAFEQALLVAQLLERHRDLDKVGFLLYLGGYPVDVDALRRIFLGGLDSISREITRAADGATDPDEIAARMAHTIVGERARTADQRAFKDQMLQSAGDQRQLTRFYASLIRPAIGAPLSSGGLFAAYKIIGQDFRTMLGLDPAEFAKVEQRIDSNDRELNAEGGILELLRRAIPNFELENFVNFREFLRAATTWTAGLGVSMDSPHPYFSNCLAALAYRELPLASKTGPNKNSPRAARTAGGTAQEGEHFPCIPNVSRSGGGSSGTAAGSPPVARSSS